MSDKYNNNNNLSIYIFFIFFKNLSLSLSLSNNIFFKKLENSHPHSRTIMYEIYVDHNNECETLLTYLRFIDVCKTLNLFISVYIYSHIKKHVFDTCYICAYICAHVHSYHGRQNRSSRAFHRQSSATETDSRQRERERERERER
jgi:hypothetical protein